MAASTLALVGSAVARIFGQNHAAAIAAEANNLNAAFPSYARKLQQIVAAYNGGTVDGPTASMAVDEVVQEYYAAVHGIIKDSSNGGTACTPADASGRGSNCNGPCTVGCAWVVPWATQVKSLINAGGGTASFNAVPAHAGFNGFPPWSISVSAPAQNLLTDHTGVNIPGPGVPSFIGSPAPAPQPSFVPASVFAPTIPSIQPSGPGGPTFYASGQLSRVPSLAPNYVGSPTPELRLNQGAITPSNPLLLILAGFVAVGTLIVAILSGGRKR